MNKPLAFWCYARKRPYVNRTGKGGEAHHIGADCCVPLVPSSEMANAIGRGVANAISRYEAMLVALEQENMTLQRENEILRNEILRKDMDPKAEARATMISRGQRDHGESIKQRGGYSGSAPSRLPERPESAGANINITDSNANNEKNTP